jgi:TM2 domain-containing membrane protein YozV
MSTPEDATPSAPSISQWSLGTGLRPSPLPGAQSLQALWRTRDHPVPSVVAALAFIGAFTPTPIAPTGLHKFYLGHPRWGVLYLLLGWTPIPRVACALEGMGYLIIALKQGALGTWLRPQDTTKLGIAAQTQAMAAAIRDLERLRQEGLITEQEFEHQRRQLLETDL